ncbi:hypothetical protein [Paenibacillus sp. GCM10027626]|uniref:hypothetical protein n=1 Tax=Paenibacillus sp. GCM10027626 TaxID=3273411 RepID=UPI00362C1128
MVELMQPYGVLELCRAGTIAMTLISSFRRCTLLVAHVRFLCVLKACSPIA